MQLAAIIAGIAIAALAVFQIALALGAPGGAAAWGGQNPGVLPTRLRIASGLVGIFFYPVLAVFVLDAGRVVDSGFEYGTPAKVFMWVLAALFILGALANFASRSKVERLWGPVALVTAVCCGVVAAGM